MGISRSFDKFAQKTSMWVGSPSAFVIAVTVVAVWALTGPVFEYSENWQLAINTGTTIITFLMVFIIQHTQNRDGRAIQLKLDELIRSGPARNRLIDVEELSDKELDELQAEFLALHKKACGHLEKRRSGHHGSKR
jgi:low affinity Fe/Cu permease